ncbi:myozenin-3 isoform X1 [Manis javanica]|uniref:myozenin-3 isoform X1 n=1 Tax=Manis javanica TaxID=9974 RepID=UPI0018795D89|nr:myozenin-3 isoform X3 [Manis javanica]XP_036849901.1 myozenin-3 isoform X3 [Manis javanica]XP_036849902.1 myozenin-3 isoform X3 [Manis javanica]
MIPKEQKGPVMAAMGDLAGPVPLLDLGKKLSVPQDLMMEELSLRNNRGSLLFQKRQRRVQKFIFEFAASQQAVPGGGDKGKVTGTAEPGTVAKGPDGENYRPELHIFSASPGGPADARAAAPPAECARSPRALAPGYAEPLKEVPREKFNHTAIPKGYRCPWQEFISCRDYKGDGRSHIRSLVEYRNFNKKDGAGAPVLPILSVQRPAQKYRQPAQHHKARKAGGLGPKPGASDSRPNFLLSITVVCHFFDVR